MQEKQKLFFELNDKLSNPKLKKVEEVIAKCMLIDHSQRPSS